MTKPKAKPLIVQAAKAQTDHPLKNLLLIYLADYWSAEKGAYPSHTTLAKRCGGDTTRQHVQRLLKQMEKEGWVTVKRNYSPTGAQNTNTYHLNPAKLGVTTGDKGCNVRLQGVQQEATGGATTEHPISLLKSPMKSLVKSKPSAFDAFYDSYPKKVDRKGALKAWQRLDPSPALINRIMADVQQRLHTGHWSTGKDKKYIPGPAPYLNGEKWTDEIIPREGQPIDLRQLIDGTEDLSEWIK